MRFPLFQEPADGFSDRLTCGVLGFSTQAFYKWKRSPVCRRDVDDAHVVNAIVDIHGDEPEFGSRSPTSSSAAATRSERAESTGCASGTDLVDDHEEGPESSGKIPGPAIHGDLLQSQFSPLPRRDLAD